MQRTWRFFLEWVPGGEDYLKDERTHFMMPWWEPDHPQHSDQHPLFKPSETLSSTLLESGPDITITGPIRWYSPLLLPTFLLAPFSEITIAAGIFPAGYCCPTCGRINVQRFLRHRICEGVECVSRSDPQRETGWAVDAFSTRDRKISSAKVVPEDTWADLTTDGLPTAFDDGACLFQYHMTGGDFVSVPSVGPSDLPPDAGADTHKHSVRHVFNGERAPLQEDASALFETLQRDVRIERSIGASVFTTPLIESRDDPALGPNGPNVWDQQRAFIEKALGAYCRDLGPLKVKAWRVHAWSSGGKVRMPVAHGQLLRTHARCSCSTFRRSVSAPNTSCCSASVPTSRCSLSLQIPIPKQKTERKRKSAFA